MPTAAADDDAILTTGLRIGFVPGVTLTKWRRIWADRFPETPLTVVEIPEPGQRAALEEGVVDMCFVRFPVDLGGLHAIELYEEIQAVVVEKDHEISTFNDVTLADLASETLLEGSEPSDLIERVSSGAGVAIVPLSVARTYHRRDVTHRPVTDAPTTPVALAWLPSTRGPLVPEFVGIIRGRSASSSRTAQERATSAIRGSVGDEHGKARTKSTGGRKAGTKVGKGGQASEERSAGGRTADGKSARGKNAGQTGSSRGGSQPPRTAGDRPRRGRGR
jgi:DNA-binding transcriptional LysR family regulator